MKYLIHTFGCQANEHDSEIIAGVLEQKGYSEAEKEEDADIILFNTCCVREKAENKVFSRIGALKGLKSRHANLIIGICGCMVQQDKMAEKIRRRTPHVDLIFGTNSIHELPAMLERIRASKEAQVLVHSDMTKIAEGLPSQRKAPYKGLVHITYGCNNFCTYCIVPYVRGREKSRQAEHILAEIKEMVKTGLVEVMLLGQNVNSYGKDLLPPLSFADLLLKINQIEGLRRIRYMTSHPRDFSARLINVIAEAHRVCRHFHLPVQAGSNRILNLMNRGYTREEYLELVRKIRSVFPEASITTDIIVGFPSETKEDFRSTIDLIEEAKFDSAFTFIYSPRTGTPAARMEGQVATEEKKERLHRLMGIQNKISLEINNRLKDKVLEVLVEGYSKTSQDMLTGRTDTNKSVLFAGKENLTGKFVDVKITHPQTWVLKGELVKGTVL